MTEHMGRGLALNAGFVKEMVTSRSGITVGRSFKAHIHINISNPMNPGCWLSIPRGRRMWIEFKYERLPNFCYIYDCLDHNNKDCDRELELKHEGTYVYRGYGSWIYAETYVSSKKNNGLPISRSTRGPSSHSVNDEECSSRYNPTSSSPAVVGMVAGARAQLAPFPNSGQYLTNRNILGKAPIHYKT